MQHKTQSGFNNTMSIQKCPQSWCFFLYLMRLFHVDRVSRWQTLRWQLGQMMSFGCLYLFTYIFLGHHYLTNSTQIGFLCSDMSKVLYFWFFFVFFFCSANLEISQSCIKRKAAHSFVHEAARVFKSYLWSDAQGLMFKHD